MGAYIGEMEVIDIAIIVSITSVAFIIGRLTKRPICTNSIIEKEASQRPICFPQITIVFQQEVEDDDDLCKEIADMYLSNRAFYYSGKTPAQDSILPEKEQDVFVSFNNIDFSKLQKIEV